MIELDARPSDAIALAIREDASFYVEEDVLNRASFPYLFKEPKDHAVELAEFRTFIDGLSPEDFV